jgi:hypothetical protein
MDDIFALLVFVIFVGAVFAGGCYAGYRYRDNLSVQRQKKRRQSQPDEASRAPATTDAGSAKSAK